MSEEIITEARVKEIVRKYLSARIEDVDEIRKSPAGRVLIIETEVKNLNDKIDRLDEKVDALKNELKNEINDVKLELRKEMSSTRLELKKEMASNKLELKNEMTDVRSGLEREIQSSKNLSLALFVAILGLIGSVFVKVFFFM